MGTVHVGIALEDSGALETVARGFAIHLPVQAFMLLGQDPGLSQTSSLSIIDGDVFGAHDGYEFRRRRKFGGARKADRLIPTRGRRNVGFVC